MATHTQTVRTDSAAVDIESSTGALSWTDPNNVSETYNYYPQPMGSLIGAAKKVISRCSAASIVPGIVCYIILFQEGCERLAYYGMTPTLKPYLKDALHISDADALAYVSLFQGLIYIPPVATAFLADVYLGTYRTILYFSAIYFAGLGGLWLSSVVGDLQHPTQMRNETQIRASDVHPLQSSLLVISLFFLITVGAGGIKSCVSVFGGQQFHPTHQDHVRQTSAFYVYFYACINVGALIGGIICPQLVTTGGMSILQTHVSGYTLAYAVPVLSFFLATCGFIMGTNYYIKIKTPYMVDKPNSNNVDGLPWQERTAVFRVLQLLTFSVKNVKSFDKYEQRSALSVPPTSCGDSVGNDAVVTELADVSLDQFSGRTSGDRAKYADISMRRRTISETRLLIRIIPLCTTVIPLIVVTNNYYTSFITQGEKMRYHVGISRWHELFWWTEKHQISNSTEVLTLAPGTMVSFDCLAVIFWSLFVEKWLYPWLRSCEQHKDKNLKERNSDVDEDSLDELHRSAPGFCIPLSMPDPITRIAFAHLIAAACLAWCWLIEVTIMQSEANTVPILWQIPSYILGALSEVLGVSTSYEICYTLAPHGLKTMSSAINLFFFSVAGFAGSFVFKQMAKQQTEILLSNASVTYISWLPDFDPALPASYHRAHYDYYFLFLFYVSLLMCVVCLVMRPFYRRVVAASVMIS